MIDVRVSESDFSLDEESQRLLERAGRVGALCSFVGYVRDLAGDEAVRGIHLEHYPAMTVRSLEQMAQQALTRWNLEAVTIIHRVGYLPAHARIVLVMVASRHRGEAFNACEFLMDYLKTQAPFWKKELLGEEAVWVDAKASDLERASRWRSSSDKIPPG